MAKTVFITGASSGIGAALTEEYVKRGDNVVVLARRLDRLQALSQKNDGKILVVQGDVTLVEDLNRAVAAARERFGGLDVVIANAGLAVVGRFDRLSISDYRRQFEVNVFGVLNTVYAVLEELKRTRGQLVLLGSVMSHISLPTTSPYSMSKFAVRALADSLRGELARDGISVTLISPGFVESEIRHVDSQGTYQATSRDPIPTCLVMPTGVCARKIMKAVDCRRSEAVITAHGKVSVLINRFIPWIIPVAARLAGRA